MQLNLVSIAQPMVLKSPVPTKLRLLRTTIGDVNRYCTVRDRIPNKSSIIHLL